MKFTSQKLKTAVVLFALGGLFLGPIRTPAYGQADDLILTTLPKDALFVLRINKFSYNIGQMDQYLAGASPIPMGITMLVNMQLAGMLGDPMMTGIDRNGTFAMVGLVPPTAEGENGEPVMAFLFPTTDFRSFISSNQYADESETPGIYTITPPNAPMGNLLAAPLAEGKFMLIGNGEEPEQFNAILSQIRNRQTSLAQAVSVDEVKRAVDAPAWLWLNLEAGYTLAAPMIQFGINKALEGMKETPGTEQSQEMLKNMSEGADELIRQLRSLTLTLTPKPEVLLTETWFNAGEGTELAKTLVRKEAFRKGFSLAGYLDPQDPLYIVFKMNKPLWIEVNRKMTELMIDSEANAEDAAFMKQFTDLMNKSVNAMGEEVAVSFSYGSGQPPFSVTEVVAVKDAKAMRDMLTESSSVINQFYRKMGQDIQFSFQTGTETYKGVRIDLANVKFQHPEDTPADQKAAMEAMYGAKGIEYPLAITDKALFLTTGPSADSELKSLIDRSQSGGTSAVPADIQTAQQYLQNTDTADMLMTLDVIELMKGLAGMMQTLQEALPEQPQKGPDFSKMLEGIPMESQSAMALAMRAEDGRLKLQYALPKQHLAEITNVAMQIQMKAMQQRQLPQAQEAPGEEL